MTPRKLTARGEMAKAQAMSVAREAAARSRRKRTPWLPTAQADLVAYQRAAAPPQPLPPTDDESEAPR